MTRAGLFLFVSMISATACSSASSLDIEVATGLVPGPEFVLVTTELIEDAERFDLARTLTRVETQATYGQAFARGRRVASFSGLAAGTHTVRVRLWRANGTLLIERRTRLTLDGDMVVRVHLTRDCVGVECPAPAGSAALTECLAGRCVDPSCIAHDPTSCPGVVFCNDATECPPVSSCAAQTCNEGVCEPTAIEGACTAVQWCDPDPGAGCLAAPIELDGGTASDASIGEDGARVCGGPCDVVGAPCTLGLWDCSTTPANCSPFASRLVGATCADGSVCNTRSECVSCRTNAPCRIGCDVGHVACSSGAEECVLSVPVTHATLGAHCESGVACIGADECGSGDVCDASGSCVACGSGAPCTLGCNQGAIDCDRGGECVTDGSFLPTGATCGVDEHCTEDHSCVACTEGATCDSGNVCDVARVSCAGGAGVCTVLGRQPTGTGCAMDAVCDDTGTCVSCVLGAACTSHSGCMRGVINSCGSGVSCAPTGGEEPGVLCAGGMCNGAGECYAPLIATWVGAGVYHSCALRDDDSVVCFGENAYGLLGTGDLLPVPLDAKPTAMILDTASLSVGAFHTCSVTHSGELWCWGDNGSSQLGDGTMTTRPSPIHIAMPDDVASVSAGQSATCSVLVDGTIWCSGDGVLIGTGDGVTRATPTQTLGINNAVQVAVGSGHTCARLADGHINCWGYNWAGQLGDGNVLAVEPFASFAPVETLTIDDATDIAVGPQTSCAIRGGSELWCWPWEGSSMPARVALPILDAVDVEIGMTQRICVRSTAGALYCFGDNDYGQLGDGTMDYASSPIHIERAGVVSEFSLGFGLSACARLVSGEVRCWGENSAGQLGDGTTTFHTSPVVASAP